MRDEFLTGEEEEESSSCLLLLQGTQCMHSKSVGKRSQEGECPSSPRRSYVFLVAFEKIPTSSLSSSSFLASSSSSYSHSFSEQRPCSS